MNELRDKQVVFGRDNKHEAPYSETNMTWGWKLFSNN